jgi:hypothetical protein
MAAGCNEIFRRKIKALHSFEFTVPEYGTDRMGRLKQKMDGYMRSPMVSRVCVLR